MNLRSSSAVCVLLYPSLASPATYTAFVPEALISATRVLSLSSLRVPPCAPSAADGSSFSNTRCWQLQRSLLSIYFSCHNGFGFKILFWKNKCCKIQKSYIPTHTTINFKYKILKCIINWTGRKRGKWWSAKYKCTVHAPSRFTS